VEVVLDAVSRHDQPLTPQRLFGWHAAMFQTGYSGIHRIKVGAWRDDATGPMQVVSGRHGRETVHFEAPPADRIPSEMDRFLGWLSAEPTTDPAIKAGMAHLHFVTIHPFGDGNGRIARAITDLVLARAEQSPDRFYSMSAQIREERQSY
jgi:Fic family protein